MKKFKKAFLMFLFIVVTFSMCGCDSKKLIQEAEMSPAGQPETYWISEDTTFMFHVNSNYNKCSIIYTGSEIVDTYLYMDHHMSSFKICDRDDFNSKSGRVESVEYFEKGKYKVISDSECIFTFDEATYFNVGDQIAIHKVSQQEYEETLKKIGAVDNFGDLLGKTESNSYYNEFFNFMIDCGENWQIHDGNELNEIRGYSTEDLSNQELFEALSSPAGVPVFNATNDNLSGLSVTIQRNHSSSEEEYMEISQQNIPAAFESAGMKCESAEVITIEFIDTEHPALAVHAIYNGIDLYETLVAMKRGNCFSVVAATCYVENNSLELLNSFQPILK